MKILVHGELHHKNKEGLNLVSREIPVIYINNFNNIEQYDDGKTILLIVNSLERVNFSKVLYGPHIDFGQVMTYFKNNQELNIKFNMLSPWLKRLSEKLVNCKSEFITLPYPVNVEKFQPDTKQNKAFIYFKHVEDYKLNLAINLMNNSDFEYKIFRYGSYQEHEYLDYIKSCKFGIWVGSHESQGFALQEALSCNCPLFVLDVNSLKDECYNNNNYPWRNREISYDILEASSASYFDNRCGVLVKNLDFNYLQEKFKEFLEKLDSFNSRNFILENLTVKQFINNLKECYNIKC